MRGQRMSYRRALAALVLAAAMTVAACGEKKEETSAASGGGTEETAQKDCGKVVLNEQAWAGSTANTYIAKAVLEDNLGCEVEITKIAEIPVFQAMADGEVDAVLEDWQHTDEYKKYIEDAGTVVDGGPLGVEGHIGWFIPKYLMDEHPEFASWEGLKGEEDLFKTAESGDQGMFLGGDPSYVQKDKELIKALDLNLKHVTAGAEPAQVARWSQLYKQEKPVLFYWYTPQFYNQEYDLAEVEAAGAHAGLQGRRQVRRRPRAVQVRLRRDGHREAVLEEVRRQRLARVSTCSRRWSSPTTTRKPSPRRSPATRSTRSRPARTGSQQNQDKVNAWLGS